MLELQGCVAVENANLPALVHLCEHRCYSLLYILPRQGPQEVLYLPINVRVIYVVHRGTQFSLPTLSHAHWQLNRRAEQKVLSSTWGFKTDEDWILGVHVN